MASKSKLVEVIYLGERVSQSTYKIYQYFRDANGELHNFSGIKGICSGSCYHMSKTGPDYSMKVRPQWIEDATLRLSDKDVIEIEAHKIVVKQKRLERRKAMELKRPHEDITHAVNLLRPFARSLGSLELSRFMSYIENQVSKPGKKRR